MERLLIEKVVEGLKHLYDVDVDTKQVQLQKTRKEFDGDITVVVFPFLKISKKGPEQTAEDLGEFIKENVKEIDDFDVVKGFLNFSISDKYWLSLFKDISIIQNYGHAQEASGKTYMVEYASPNTNKPLHLGHLRNVFLGFSVAELLKASGHKVVKTQIVKRNTHL